MTESKSTIRFSRAINRALAAKLEQDPKVVLLGEDICDPFGGAFKITGGLSDRFPDRVLNTPMSEAALAGVVAGMALRGLKPVLEIMFGDFLTLCADQIVNHGVKFRWMYHNAVSVPYVIRTPMGGRRGYGPTHSQTLEKLFLGIPGLKVVAPSHWHNPGAQLIAAIDDPEPVLFIENKDLYNRRLAVSRDGYCDHFRCRYSGDEFPAAVIATGQAATISVTVVAYGGMVPHTIEAVRKLFLKREIGVEIIVPSLLQPLDMKPVLRSVERTGRLVVVDEATPGFGFASEVAARIARSSACLTLKQPIICISAGERPIGCAVAQEARSLPGVNDIYSAIGKICAPNAA